MTNKERVLKALIEIEEGCFSYHTDYYLKPFKIREKVKDLSTMQITDSLQLLKKDGRVKCVKDRYSNRFHWITIHKDNRFLQDNCLKCGNEYFKKIDYKKYACLKCNKERTIKGTFKHDNL